jgi:DNA helicase-2/ATP-dependent DNA helicase PcrA
MLEIKPNTKQQECIDNIDGKYLVLAGPGTGKTFTIIQRIKAMLERGIAGNKILCLTFTDAAANEMKVRLEKELNTLSVDVNIFTYHGFCCNVIDENIEEFEFPQSYRIMSDSVSRAFIKECIDEINPKYFRTEKNDPYFYIDTIKRRIDEIKKNRLTKVEYFKNIEFNPDWQPELDSLIAELETKLKKGETRVKTLTGNIETQQKKIDQAKELWEFYELYQTKMGKNHYIDYNDMINSVLTKFDSNPAFLDKIANEYEYILVDEYQDTNKSQNEIVFNLTKNLKSENVFVVGDDDQIIYTFQGAKICAP